MRRTWTIIAVLLAAGLMAVFTWKSSQTPSTTDVTAQTDSSTRPPVSPSPAPKSVSVTVSSSQPPVLGVPRSPNFDKPLPMPPGPVALISNVPHLIAEWLTDWQAAELEGKSATPQQIDELRKLLETQPVTALRMGQIVYLIAALDGNAVALPLTGAVLERAERELKLFDPPDSLAKPTVDAFWPLHDVLWEAQAYAADQKLLELLRPWEVRGSGHSQWAGYIYAEGLSKQGKLKEAYLAFRELQKERSVAFEPSEGLNRPLDLELGLMAFEAGEDVAATEHLERVVNSTDPSLASRSDARLSLIYSLARTGKGDAAEKQLRDYVKRYSLTTSESLDLGSMIEAAKLREKKGR